MLVERFSFDGFKVQHQNHHLKSIEAIINMDVSKYNELMKYELTRIQHQKLEFYSQYHHLLENGIWVFIKGCKNNQSLNHLKNKTPKYIAYLPDNTEVIDVNWSYLTTLNDVSNEACGCFIPAQNLSKIEYKGII